MKLKGKLAFAVLTVGVAFVLILVSGCLEPRCVSECVHDKTPFKDAEREMCLASSSGNDLEYWIDGARSTAGCHWHLEHVKCQGNGCLYKCKETEALWQLVGDGKAITMKKDVKGTTLPQEYHFEETR